MFINYLIGFFVFLLGLCIGSFLNCYIYRLEHKKSLKGRSFCPHCKHMLSWQDLFPVFSFLFLKGRCKYCHKKISIQYPLVELATGVLFVLLFSTQGIPASGWNFLNLVFLFYVSSSLIIIFIYDFKQYLIPDKILFPAIAITLIYNLINYSAQGGPASGWQFLNHILAALVASGFFLIIFLISRGKWMGFGDVKLVVLMGLLLGIQNVLVALFLAFFFGAIIGVILMVFPFGSARGEKRKNLKSEIPFAPFLIMGTFITMLYGNQIIQWYFRFFQI